MAGCPVLYNYRLLYFRELNIDALLILKSRLLILLNWFLFKRPVGIVAHTISFMNMLMNDEVTHRKRDNKILHKDVWEKRSKSGEKRNSFNDF